MTAESAEQAAIHTQYIFADLISFLERTIIIPDVYRNKFQVMKRRVFTAYERLRKEKMYVGGDGWVQSRHLRMAIKQLHGVTKITAAEYIERLVEAKAMAEKGDTVRWK